MKRIAASVGLVALGASGLQAADVQAGKSWSVSATLRGFYDDNINTTQNNKVDAWGYEISPSVNYGISGETTSASIGYTYSGKYYDHAFAGNAEKWSHTHLFDAGLRHAFSERFQVAVRDSFVIGQEPDVLRTGGNTFSTFQRLSGDNKRNYGSILFNAEVTPLLGFEVGYANGWYDYDNSGTTLDPFGNIQPSYSATLDRMEHYVHIDSRWHFLPQTTGIFGYQYSEAVYNGDEPIQGNVFIPASVVSSKTRNNRSHYLYGGVEHTFTPELSLSVKLGAQYMDFYNDPSFSTEWSPYGQLSLKYLFLVESSVEVGVIHQRSASDLYVPGGVQGQLTGKFVRDQEATTAYASLRHRIVSNLYGTLMGTFQNSKFNAEGSAYDDQNDRFFLLGLDLEYRFNPHISAHAGYNYDHLDSEIEGRDFTRNRAYIGVTATY